MSQTGELLRDRLQRALATDGRPGRRLGNAGTSVRLEVSDHPEASVTLLLDRHPPQLSEDPDAEATIKLDSAQTERFLRGQLVLGTCLMQGAVVYDGQVRKYLAVDPILRTILRRLDEAQE